MPYIKAEDYERAIAKPTVPGELNYAMTVAAISFMKDEIDGETFKRRIQELVDGYMNRVGVSYTNYNNAIGALFCCGYELMRRVKSEQYRPSAMFCQLVMCRVAHELYQDYTAPYEDTKIEENGDVYPKEIING